MCSSLRTYDGDLELQYAKFIEQHIELLYYVKRLKQMFIDNYHSKPLFEYAAPYCMVFPKGLEKSREIGQGLLVIEDDYLIYFRPEIPEDVKTRFIKDYAEYHKKRLESGEEYID